MSDMLFITYRLYFKGAIVVDHGCTWSTVECCNKLGQNYYFTLIINTAILGLTVLAIGNSVADLVADTVVARSGKPEMAIGSCFGAPLLSNVIGLSIALLVS